MNGQPAKTKKRKKRPWLLAAAALMVIAALVVAGVRGGARTALSEATAQRRDIVTYYSFSGNLTPVSDKVQTAKEALKVKELYVLEGDRVQKGDALLRTTDGKRVFAAYGGTVEELYLENDDSLQPGSKIARIVDYDNLEVSVDVDEYDIEAIGMGKEGAVYINALDRSVPGTVVQVARDATASGGVSYYAVKLQIAAQEDVRSGMSVEVTILNKQALNAVSLPLDAISYDEYNKPYALVPGEKDAQTPAYLELGVSDGQNVEIVSGVSDGQQVFYNSGDMTRFFPMRPDMVGQ